MSGKFRRILSTKRANNNALAYHIYKTEGWVIHSADVGEADRFVDIFSSEFGLIRAMARGVRKLDSKLRYGLQDYSFGNIYLVKGREIWRVVNVEKLDYLDRVFRDREVLKMIGRIFSLLRRLIKGEEKDRAVFDDVKSAIKLISETSLSRNDLRQMEVILVFRILQRLGYIGRDGRVDYLADFSGWDLKILKIDDLTRVAAVLQINRSISHSHL